jgi:hypothetical protein
MDAEAHELCGAGRYERSAAGYQGWQLRADLQTSAGDVKGVDHHGFLAFGHRLI